MKNLSQPESVAEIHRRITMLSTESRRQWGRMTVNQMVCHLADAYQAHTGDRECVQVSPLWKRMGMKWAALYGPAPWPKGRIATVPELDPLRDGTPPSEFAEDVERLERSLDVFVEAARERRCRNHMLFGPLSSNQWLRFGYLHADHHLRQFAE